MASTDLSRQAREILTQFRHASDARGQAAVAALEELKAAEERAALAELTAHAQAREARATAEAAAAGQRQAEGGAAAATLQEARRRATSYAESIRAAWSGADTALGLADLRQLHGIAQGQVTPIDEAPPGADSDRELARCTSEAGKAAKRIDAGVQQVLAGRGTSRARRRLIPRLVLAVVVALGSGLLLVQQAAQPCSFLRGIGGAPKSCNHAPTRHGGIRTLPTEPTTYLANAAIPSPANPATVAPHAKHESAEALAYNSPRAARQTRAIAPLSSPAAAGEERGRG